MPTDYEAYILFYYRAKRVTFYRYDHYDAYLLPYLIIINFIYLLYGYSAFDNLRCVFLAYAVISFFEMGERSLARVVFHRHVACSLNFLWLFLFFCCKN